MSSTMMTTQGITPDSDRDREGLAADPAEL